MPDRGVPPSARFADLTAACTAGDIATIAAYLGAGGRPDRADDDGETLLHYASRAGQVEVVRMLVRKGADPSAVNRFGDTFRDVAIDSVAGPVAPADDTNWPPEIDADELVFTWDVQREGHEVSYVVRSLGTELIRIPITYDDATPFEAAAQRLRDRYGARVRDLVPSDDAERALFGDSLAAARRVEAVREALRTGGPLPSQARSGTNLERTAKATATGRADVPRPPTQASAAPAAAALGDCPGQVVRVATSPDGRFVAASHAHGVEVWITSTGERVGGVTYAPSPLVLGFLADPLELVVHDAGAAGGHSYVHAVNWSNRSARVLVDVESPPLLRALAVSPDGRTIAVVLRHAIVSVDGSTGATVATSRWIDLDFEAVEQQVQCAFSAAGTNVIVVRFGQAARNDGTFGTRPFAEVVTTTTGGAHVSAVHTRARLPGLIAPTLSPAGDVIVDVTTDRSGLELREVATLETQRVIAGGNGGHGPVQPWAISLSGTWLVCTRGNAGLIEVWDIPTGRPVSRASLPGGDEATCCAISADERWAVLGTLLGRVVRIDLPNGSAAAATSRDEAAGAALAAVTADPDADEPRRAYVRWLETSRRGEPEAAARAELIRLQLPWAGEDGAGGCSRPAPPSSTRRQQELLETWGQRWAADIATLTRSYRFHRGFVEQVEVDAATFLRHHDRLYAAAPIRHLQLREVLPWLQEVVRSPALRQIRSLDLASEAIGDDGVRMLASSPNLGALEWLDLSHTGAGLDGLDALAASPHLRSLLYLEWVGNACDSPSPAVFFDWDGGIAHWQETEIGRRLTERHGNLPWTRLIAGVRWPPGPGDL